MTKYYKQGSNEPSSIPELTADNLTTADVNTPLSANQGVVIKAALDERVTTDELASGLSTKADEQMVINGLGGKANVTTTDALSVRLDEIELFALAGL